MFDKVKYFLEVTWPTSLGVVITMTWPQFPLLIVWSILILQTIVILILRYRVELRKFTGSSLLNSMKRMASYMAIPFLVFVIIFGTIYIDQLPSKHVWVHPTLDMNTQERLHAECKMKAVEAVGGGGSISKSTARREYTGNCLIANGFFIKER